MKTVAPRSGRKNPRRQHPAECWFAGPGHPSAAQPDVAPDGGSDFFLRSTPGLRPGLTQKCHSERSEESRRCPRAHTVSQKPNALFLASLTATSPQHLPGSLAPLGISARGSDAPEAPQLQGRCLRPRILIFLLTRSALSVIVIANVLSIRYKHSASVFGQPETRRRVLLFGARRVGHFGGRGVIDSVIFRDRRGISVL
jgi:hypothetical protein